RALHPSLPHPPPNPHPNRIKPKGANRPPRNPPRLPRPPGAGKDEGVAPPPQKGVTHSELEYYGLEYKYISHCLQGKLSREACVQKLETEIHRYAKRQMTYFRKMEKDGANIHWIPVSD